MNDTRFESCIKCTVCTTVCPVSGVNPRYPGPKQAGPDGERLRLKDGKLYDEALKYCINCKRCEVACPSDVKIGDIIQRARARYSTQKPTLRDAILSHTDLMGSVSTPFAPLVNAATSLKPVRQLLDATLKIDHHRSLPKYSHGTFRRWYRSVAAEQAQYADQVAFFQTNSSTIAVGDRRVHEIKTIDLDSAAAHYPNPLVFGGSAGGVETHAAANSPQGNVLVGPDHDITQVLASIDFDDAAVGNLFRRFLDGLNRSLGANAQDLACRTAFGWRGKCETNERHCEQEHG